MLEAAGKAVALDGVWEGDLSSGVLSLVLVTRCLTLGEQEVFQTTHGHLAIRNILIPLHALCREWCPSLGDKRSQKLQTPSPGVRVQDVPVRHESRSSCRPVCA